MRRLEYLNNIEAGQSPAFSSSNMKEQIMSEPISSTAGGVFAWKAIGGLAGMGGIGAGLATYVVMSMTKPKTEQEWHIAFLSTLIGSIGGGAALVKYLHIEAWANDLFGLMGLFGICFMCGLPAWLIVRSFFAYAEKKKNADITELVADGTTLLKQVKDAI